MKRYVEDFIKGRHSIRRTFFINYALPLTLLLLVQKTVLSPLLRESELHRATTLLSLLAVYTLVTIATGIALNRHSRAETGSSTAMSDVALANATLIAFSLYLVFSLLDLMTGRLSSNFVPAPIPVLEINSNPEIVLSNDNNGQLHLRGSIGRGATKRLEAFIEQQAISNMSLSLLVLNSEGGNIYEARGLAKLVRDHQLNTHVEENCLSACTVVFVSGKKRTATSSAQFGFHAYHMDSNYPELRADSSAEQLKDNQLFRDNGVQEEFIEKIAKTKHSEIWLPSLSDLLDAGLLHQLQDKP